MGNINCQMFFSSKLGSRKAGWTESHYAVNATGLPGALSNLIVLGSLRANLLGAGCSIDYFRVSDDSVYRDSQVAPGLIARPVVPPLTQINLPNMIASGPDVIYNNDLTAEAASLGPPADVRCDMPWSGVLVRLEATTPFINRRSLLLRGCPDYVIQSATDRPIPGRWATALGAYVAALTGSPPGTGGWGFRALLNTGVGAPVPITSINTVSNLPTFTVAGAQFVVGASVRIRGTKLVDALGGFHTFDGVYTISVQAGTVLTMLGLAASGAGFTVLKNGTMQLRSYVTQAYVKEVDRRWGKRNTGVPFDQPRGRRRTKRLLRS